MGPGRPIDPGGDRVSATPVQDACATFPDANLLAINVSGQPIFTDASDEVPAAWRCASIRQPVAPQEIMELGDGYRRRRRGRAATRAALARLTRAVLPSSSASGSIRRAHATDRKRVIIVGAGFGGLAAAKALGSRDDGSPVEVTVIDRLNYHLFQPLLYQVAMAGLAATDVAYPIRAALHGRRNVVGAARPR